MDVSCTGGHSRLFPIPGCRRALPGVGLMLDAQDMWGGQAGAEAGWLGALTSVTAVVWLRLRVSRGRGGRGAWQRTAGSTRTSDIRWAHKGRKRGSAPKRKLRPGHARSCGAGAGKLGPHASPFEARASSGQLLLCSPSLAIHPSLGRLRAHPAHAPHLRVPKLFAHFLHVGRGMREGACQCGKKRQIAAPCTWSWQHREDPPCDGLSDGAAALHAPRTPPRPCTAGRTRPCPWVVRHTPVAVSHTTASLPLQSPTHIATPRAQPHPLRPSP